MSGFMRAQGSEIALMVIAVIILFAVLAVILVLVVLPSSNNANTIVADGNMSTANLAVGTVVIVNASQRIDNFLVLEINSSGVNGLLYTEYPVAELQGSPDELHIGDQIGYSCDGTLAKLSQINGTEAAFTVLASNSSKYGCPV